jgi:hypothetical protein
VRACGAACACRDARASVGFYFAERAVLGFFLSPLPPAGGVGGGQGVVVGGGSVCMGGGGVCVCERARARVCARALLQWVCSSLQG